MNKLYFLILNLIFLFLATGCGLETKTFAEFYEGDLEDVSKIVIVDGNSGYKKTITDKEMMNSFLNEIKNIKFIPKENQESRVGFNYSISLFEDGEEFQFGPTSVNGNYYYTEPDIHPIISSYYKKSSH